MPITPKPTAARQQRRRHRGRRCVSGRSGAWVGPRAKRKACFPLAAPTLGRGRSVIQTLFQSGKPGYRRVGASAYATQRARVPQRFGGGQMFQPPLKVFLREGVACRLCHAPDVMPATAVPAGCPATTHHGQAGRILPHHAPLPRRRPDAAGSLPATDHPTHGSSRVVGRLPRMPHTFLLVDRKGAFAAQIHLRPAYVGVVEEYAGRE